MGLNPLQPHPSGGITAHGRLAPRFASEGGVGVSLPQQTKGGYHYGSGTHTYVPCAPVYAGRPNKGRPAVSVRGLLSSKE